MRKAMRKKKKMNYWTIRSQSFFLNINKKQKTIKMLEWHNTLFLLVMDVYLF